MPALRTNPRTLVSFHLGPDAASSTKPVSLVPVHYLDGAACHGEKKIVQAPKEATQSLKTHPFRCDAVFRQFGRKAGVAVQLAQVMCVQGGQTELRQVGSFGDAGLFSALGHQQVIALKSKPPDRLGFCAWQSQGWYEAPEARFCIDLLTAILNNGV